MEKTYSDLVLDTTSLHRLAIEVPRALLTPEAQIAMRPVHFWDLVPVLARRGFKIKVAEAASYMGGMLVRYGQSLEPHLPACRSYPKELNRTIGQLLGKSVRDGDVQIVAPGPSDTSHPGNFIRELYEIHMSSAMDAEKREKFAKLVGIAGQNTYQAIAASHELVSSLSAEKKDRPVFYLSDYRQSMRNYGMLRDLGENVHILTMNNFLEALTQEKLLEMAGICNGHARSYCNIMSNHVGHQGLEVRRIIEQNPARDLSVQKHFIGALKAAPEPVNAAQKEIFADKLSQIDSKAILATSVSQPMRKKRGIIVVDSSVLFELATVFSHDYLIGQPDPSGHPVRLWDTLSVLAKNGFKIIVPEMVAYETGMILRGGETTSQYFARGASDKPLTTQLENLLRTSFLSGHIDIVPPPPQDVSEAAAFMRNLNRIHSNKDFSLKEKSVQLHAALRAHDKKDYGDIAAQKLIASLKNDGVPIFYLSNDTRATTNVLDARKDGQAHALTRINFIDGLRQRHIFPLIGVQEVPVEMYARVITDYLVSSGFRPPMQGMPKYTSYANQKFFSDTLVGIKAKSKPTVAPGKPEEPTRSNLDKFNEKYARFTRPKSHP